MATAVLRQMFAILKWQATAVYVGTGTEAQYGGRFIRRSKTEKLQIERRSFSYSVFLCLYSVS